MEQITQGQYRIARLLTSACPIEKHSRFHATVIAFTWILWLLYFVTQSVLASRSVHFASRSPCWASLVAEFLLSVQELVLATGLLVGLCSGGRRREPRPSYELLGQSAPSIDVTITCCGEAVDIILDTVRAAASQEFPTERLRVLVLDDGHDEELRLQVAKLRCDSIQNGFSTIEYRSRDVKKGEKSFFKAGNHNYGINQTREDGPSEYIAGLDCDMIPEPDWLKKSIGHLILDDKLGMTVSPQRYYNVPPGDPLGQQADFSMYFSVQEILNDSLHACMCTGTGYVARRRALEDIGGWPLVECGEDYMCSAVLSDAGWGIAYVRDNLQYGLCPESMQALLKQRMRWTDAAIEVFKQFRFYLGRTGLTAQMTWDQRMVNLLYVFRDYAPVTTVFALMTLPLLLYPSRSPDIASKDTPHPYNLVLAVRYLCLAQWVSNKLCYLLIYHHIGLSRVWNFQSNEIWAAPYMAYRCLLSLLPTNLGLTMPTFVVCGAIPGSERSLHSRPSIHTRLLNRNTLLWMSYILYASIPLVLVMCLSNGTFFPLPGPVLKLVSSILKMAVPVRYMLFPPTMPERHKMLYEDEKGVRRIKKEWKDSGEDPGDWGLWALVCAVELVTLGLMSK